jgi:long-chain acyl-CoA synthetase
MAKEMEKSLISLFRERVHGYANDSALYAKDHNDNYFAITYGELYELVSQFGAGLMSLGINRNAHIGLVSDNRKEWIIADFGILGIGASDVPRGSDSTEDEIAYILHHADCEVSLLEDEVQLRKVFSIRNKLPLLKTVIVMDDQYSKKDDGANNIDIHTFGEIIEKGKLALAAQPDLFDAEAEKTEGDQLATIIYTSGTTGEPKGVMLTHSNFLHQVRAPLEYLDVRRGDIFLSVLPIWHAFERAAEYVALFAGCSVAYSKLIGKVMLSDMEAIRPTIFPSVPRIWELVRTGIYKTVRDEGGIKLALFNFFVGVGGIHSKLLTMCRGLTPQFRRRNRIIDILASLLPLIVLTPFKILGDVLVFAKLKAKLGGRFKFGISGAGALPQHVDSFFSACGILLLEGYGLTEAAPICSVRKDRAPVPGTIGPPLPEMEAKIVDARGNRLPPGNKGILFVKGPNVMKGYYKKPEETKKVLSEDGWLNTGDLAIMTYNGELSIRGRVKETIVLMGGENVEPSPLEDTILQSDYISQAVVIGQDQRFLGALVLLNKEITEHYAAEHGIQFDSFDSLINRQEIIDLIRSEINERINMHKGFKPFERIARIKILNAEFRKGVEMTHTLKLKRDMIAEKYKKEIDVLFKQETK